MPKSPMISRNLRSRTIVLVPVAALSATAVVVATAQTHHDDGTTPVSATRAVYPESPTPAPTLSPATTPSAAPTPAAPGAVAAPASVTTPTRTSPVGTSVPAALRARPSTVGVAASKPTAVSSTALAAYQRAASVIDQASAGCHLDWQLLAAIGQVESADGTAGGSQLGTDGVASPAIFGPVLDGRHHTRQIADTDGGRLDGDGHFDRAVGPMQILPATWLGIAVDGDGDGRRDPQDINDAALASAVYLCSSGADLATPAGRKTALLRYNHSNAYATAVLTLATDYLADPGLGAGSSVIPATYALPAVPGTGSASSAESAPSTEPAPAHQPSQTKHLGRWTNTAKKPTKVTTSTTGTGTSTPAPAPVIATADQLEGACRTAITKAYPDATSAALAAASARCAAKLAGLTLPRATAQIAGVLKGIAPLVDGLVPTPAGTPSPEPPSAPSSDPSSGPTPPQSSDQTSPASADPSTEPSSDPSTEPSTEPSSAPSSPVAGSASATPAHG